MFAIGTRAPLLVPHHIVHYYFIQYVLSSGKDSLVKLWELSTNRCLIVYTGAGTIGKQEHRTKCCFNHTEDYGRNYRFYTHVLHTICYIVFNWKWQNDVFVTSYLIGDGKFLLWLLTILANLNELYKQPLLGYLYGRIGSTCYFDICFRIHVFVFLMVNHIMITRLHISPVFSVVP